LERSVDLKKKNNIDYLFLLGSRGEWGYIRPLIEYCKKNKKNYGICLTNMVVIPEYGIDGVSLGQKIINEGYNVVDSIEMSLEGSTHFTMFKSLSLMGLNFIETLKRINPKFLILAGDRGEQLIGAIAAAYSYIPIAHIQAGEKSGNIDGTTRHAIARFAHIHFASNKDAADRLIKSGEEKFRIFNVGAPQLDEIKNKKYSNSNKLKEKFKKINFDKFLLVIFHPVTEEYNETGKNIKCLLSALKKFKMDKVWILPNNDAGSSIVKNEILLSRDTNTHIFSNLDRELYFGLIKESKLVVGNSSSGIIETPSFNKVSINIGNRQEGRYQSKLTLNSSYKTSDIVNAIKKGLLIKNKKKIQNPYGDGNSTKKIFEILKAQKFSKKLLIKKITI
jgi:GDP/UDP-N,N'-diacetylbacillosamine 2-epimerase (hydrolysing)